MSQNSRTYLFDEKYILDCVQKLLGAFLCFFILNNTEKYTYFQQINKRTWRNQCISCYEDIRGFLLHVNPIEKNF